MTKKIDRRRKYIMVVDVETAGGFDKPLVYDLGFAICDKQGRIYEKHSFAIEEIIDNREIMETAYYKKKLPKYHTQIEKGEMLKVPFSVARDKFLETLKEYRASQISAYNLAFDMNALQKTAFHILSQKRFLTTEQKGIELKDIWSFACETIFTQNTFQKAAIKQGWISEAKNVKTSAEIGYRYITDDYDFIEEHMGLQDVEIECQILAHCYKQRKKHNAGILTMPWKIPNSKEFKELRIKFE